MLLMLATMCKISLVGSKPSVMTDAYFFFSDTQYLLDCVRVARGSCPNMALLGDEEFAAAVDNMGLVYNTYCAGGCLCLSVCACCLH